MPCPAPSAPCNSSVTVLSNTAVGLSPAAICHGDGSNDCIVSMLHSAADPQLLSTAWSNIWQVGFQHSEHIIWQACTNEVHDSVCIEYVAAVRDHYIAEIIDTYGHV